MTLYGVMAVTLRYVTEFGKLAFQHITASASSRKLFFLFISSADVLLVFFWQF